MATIEHMKVNPKYKDRLFCLIFGDKEQKGNIISLYNALNDTDYDDSEDIKVTTIDDVIYINMKNDVSFIIDSYMSLFEQQSSINPNMPLRGFLYFGNLYNSYITENKLNLYGKTLLKIPTPQYYVLYNGSAEAPASSELTLSESFVQNSPKGKFEWTATFINLNKGKNDDLLEKCKPLSGYMKLIHAIRENEAKGMDIKHAIDMAVQSCINDDQNVLREFLRIHRAEVLSVCLTEFNQEIYTESVKEEGRAEGRMEGRMEGRIEGRAEALVEGLEALVTTLKHVVADSEDIFQMVVKNDTYKNLTREEVFKYL